MPLWPCCDAGPCVAARVPQKLGAAAEEPAGAALESLEVQVHGLAAMTPLSPCAGVHEVCVEDPVKTAMSDRCDSEDEVVSTRSIIRTTDLEILRGITLRESLHRAGALWRTNPRQLTPKAQEECYQRSRYVDHLDIFISHTWQSSGISKTWSLLLQSGWQNAAGGWLLGVALAFVLCATETLPLPFSLGVPLADLCFIDAACIHQTDAALMHRGIRGIGSFLLVSKELRILWSPAYLQRLWCVFELATYKKMNISGRISLSPLFVEKAVMTGYFGVLCLAAALFILRVNRSRTIFSGLPRPGERDRNPILSVKK